MIDDYFENLEKTVLDFKRIIKSYSIFKKAYNEKQGYIKGDIVFANNSQLCFIEVKNTEVHPKNKYRYHYMDKNVPCLSPSSVPFVAKNKSVFRARVPCFVFSISRSTENRHGERSYRVSSWLK